MFIVIITNFLRISYLYKFIPYCGDKKIHVPELTKKNPVHLGPETDLLQDIGC